MKSGIDARRRAFLLAGVSLAAVVAALIVVWSSGASSGALVVVTVALLASLASVAFLAVTTPGEASGDALRDLARKVKPGAASADPLKDLAGGVDTLLAQVRDVQQAAEAARRGAADRVTALERNHARLLAAQKMAHVGDWEWLSGPDRLSGSEEFARLLGLKPGETPGPLDTWLGRIQAADRVAARGAFDAAVAAGEAFSRELRVVRPTGDVRDLFVWGQPVRDGSGAVLGLAGAAQDITDERRAERDLAARSGELERSNSDLEQFAYAASHDLQEPLRMVSSYVQLLARRYRGKLDREADEFIAFAVDGAERMQKLIRDLLTYSRVTRTVRPNEPVDLGASLRTALTNLKVIVEECSASVTAEPLPTVTGDATGLTALLQNLLSNALKFRSVHPPNIHVGVERRGEEWRIFVRDDGIGFDPRQADRIFIIFQRLHAADKYEGSGIGLAICKKIVERHGGRIWAEGTPGEGATFSFTIPVAVEKPAA